MIYRHKDIYINNKWHRLNHHIRYGKYGIFYPGLKHIITVRRGFYLVDLNNLFLKYGDSFKLKLSQLLASGDIFTDKDIMSFLDTKLGFQKFNVELIYESTPKKLPLENIKFINRIFIKQQNSFKYLTSIEEVDLNKYDTSKLRNKNQPGKSLLELIFNLDTLKIYCRDKCIALHQNDPKYCIGEHSFGLISLILTLRLCRERNKNYLRI